MSGPRPIFETLEKRQLFIEVSLEAGALDVDFGRSCHPRVFGLEELSQVAQKLTEGHLGALVNRRGQARPDEWSQRFGHLRKGLVKVH